MSQHDSATELTLKYLTAIEKWLNITWNEHGQPVCIIDWIYDESIQKLRGELGDLFSGTLSEKARQATVDYGNVHIQTVGFGHASDFDQFVKLGFIYGERVVLWDVISSRLFMNKNSTPRLKSLLAHTACNLLLLRPVVESGGLVILPHPISWSDLAKKVDIELRSQGNKSAAALGLSMALAAVEEGLPLHPYTLLISDPQLTAHEEVNTQEQNLYSTENYIFHSAISSLLKDQRVAYLQGVSVTDFYSVISEYPELQRALRKHFISDLKGLSPQQTASEINHLTDDLISLIDKRNTAIIDYKSEGIDATARFLLTSTTLLSLSQGLTTLDALGVAGALAIPFSTTVRKWAKTPENNVIVQAFKELQDKETLAQTPQFHPINTSVANNIEIHESIAEVYDQFMSFSWTEQRHHFLEMLSPEVAKELLRMLDTDDLEVIVNYRQFQQDYIGDYLAYLCDLDEDSYWEHLGKTFESPEGLLIYDDDAHIQNMCSMDMPIKVWIQLLNSLLVAYGIELNNRSLGYPLGSFPDIFRFQTEKVTDSISKREALIAWFNPITGAERESVVWFLNFVYGHELPQWFVDLVGSEAQN